MTISTELNRSGPYAGTGLNTVFPFRFRVDDKRHLRVVKIQADGSESALILDLEYGVTGVGKREGGSVVLTEPLPAGVSLVLVRDQPFVQETDLVNQGPFFAEQVELDFDHSVMRDQELAEQLSRAVTVPLGEATDPKDYLAQMKALLAQALAAIQGQSEVSVLAHGAKGDRETNDLAAFQAARDRAIELGLDYVLIPVPPDPDDWYYLVGDIEGVADVEWRIDPRAAINGSTNLFTQQRKVRRAGWWEPTVTEVEIKAPDQFYSHQVALGMDLDGEYILGYQLNRFYGPETSDQQEVGYWRSTDGGEGESWSGPVRFATDSSHCTNPLPLDGEAEGVKFTLWRVNTVNFAHEGFGQKLWLTFGHGRGSGIGGFGVAQKTAAEGKFTLYHFYMLADGTVKPIRYGDSVPEGASYLWQHEGREGLFPYCHGAFFSAAGRLHLLQVLVPRAGGNQNDLRKTVCVLYCDNPAADIDEMVFTLGPSIDFGDMDPANFWEWSIAEQDPGFFVAMMRRNEGVGGVGAQEGQRHFVAFGDGVAFSGWKPAGIHAHRDRASLVRLNNEHMAYITLDEPSSRANPSVWLKRRDGGIAPALTVGTGNPLTRQKSTIRPTSAADTVWAAVDDDEETIDFSGKRVGVTQFVSAEDRIELVSEGFIPDWPEQTIDFGRFPFSAGDTLVGERDGRRETLFVDGGKNTTFSLEIDLTAGSPLVEAFEGDMGTTVAVGSGGAVIDTANDMLTFQGSATDVDFLVVNQTGLVDSKVILSAEDSLWNLSADATIAIADGSFEARLIEGADPEITHAVPELDFIASTAANNVTFLGDRSGSDRFVIDVLGGSQTHVPTGFRHPVTGDLIVGWAPGPMAPWYGGGGKGLRVALIRAEDFPRSDRLNVIPRRNAQVEDAEPGHSWTWNASSQIAELKGKQSVGVDLPAGRWQVSLKLRLSALPSTADNAQLVQVGNFERIASLEAVWRRPFLNRDLYLIERAAGPREFARGAAISRRMLDGVSEESEVYSLADDLWVGVTFRYDSYRGELSMEGRTIRMQWPFVLTVGDGYLLSDAPTDRSLYLDVGGIEVIPLSEGHREWNPPRARPHGPNIITRSGFDIDRLRKGERFSIGAPRAGLPGWSLVEDGGCSVTWRRSKNSQEAANRDLGAWPWGMRIDVDNAVTLPTTAATGEVRFAHSWPGLLSVTPGQWFLQFDALDLLEEGEQLAARESGLPIKLYWFQDFGGIDGKRRYTPLYPLRVLRSRQTFALPVTVPQPELNASSIIREGSACGLEWRILSGLNCRLQITKPQFFQGEAPRDWSPPDPLAPDETRRLFFEVPAGTIGGAVAQGRMVSASVFEGLIDLPDMVAAPAFREVGAFAIEHNGSLYTGQPKLKGEPTRERALIEMTAPGAGLTAGEAVLLQGISPNTLELTGADNRLFDIDPDLMLVEAEDDVTVKKIDSGGSTAVETLYEDYSVRPSYARQWDRLPVTSGSSILTTELSLPNNLTAIDLVRWTTTGGEETLPLGDGGWTAGLPDEGDATFTLLDSSGTGIAAVSGQEYQARLNPRYSPGQIIMHEVVASSSTLLIEHAHESNAALQFDARIDRPVWDRVAAADSLIDAFTGPAPAARRDLIDLTIRRLQEEGIWDDLDLLYCLAAHDAQAASLNWKAPGSHALTATNAPLFTAGRGYLCDGSTSYLEAAWAPASDGANFTQDDASLIYWVFSCDPTAGDAIIGGVSGGGPATRVSARDGTPQFYNRMNDAQNQTGTPILPDVTEGYFAVDRAGSGGYVYYGEGGNEVLRAVSLTQASTGLPTGNLRIGRAASEYGAAECAWMAAGASLDRAKHQVLARILRDYLFGTGVLP